MSKYTTELRHLHSQGFDFGLDLYPIFDESYREMLNTKILDHYRYREIGAETPQRFRHYLVSKMNEIMPLYNQMYKSELLEFNPLYSTDYEETSTKETTGQSLNNNTGAASNTQTINRTNSTIDNATGLMIESDTPGGMISVGSITDNTYASKANQSESGSTITGTDGGTVEDAGTNSLESNTNISNLDDYVKKVKGNTGNKNLSEMLLDFRATFLNIDMLVIDELNDCFMGVY